MTSLFTVKQVFGGVLRGDVTSDGASTFSSLIRLNEIAMKFERHGDVKIRDFTDYFLVNDRFQVSVVDGHILDCVINVKELRLRRFSANFAPFAGQQVDHGFGYVIAVVDDTLHIWSNIGGGSFVRACHDSICTGALPQTEGLNPPPVVITVRKITPDPSRHRYCTFTHEAISVHYPNDRRAIQSYFPSFQRVGIIDCILENDYGAILKTNATQTGGVEPGFNLSRPVPQEGELVYCPPWSFVDQYTERRYTETWASYCRWGQLYYTCIVYVGSDQQLAFDCKWIAVGAKKYERPITAGAPSPKPTERDYQRAKETTDKYVAYAQRMSRWSDWDPETSRKRVLETMNRIAVESGIEFGASVAVASTFDSASVKRHYETDFEQNCATLLEFMLKRNNEAAATASTSASSISDPIEHNRWRVSEGAQTDTDLELFKQLRDWAYDVSMSVHPNQLEEFWARFARIESSFGRQ